MTSAPDEPRPVTIAVIDDDASVRVSLKRLCEALGFRTRTYASGAEFLASLDGRPPDLDCLLLDSHMPEMTGSELHHHLLASGVDIPTIVFTADDSPDAGAHYAPTGIVACLQKPLGSESLVAAVERAIKLRL
jgi:FixJ family two-component response regulator